MTTIAKEIHTRGSSLMKNLDCEVTIKPSNQGYIRLFVKNEENGFKACIDNVISTDHCVTLASREHRTLLGGYKYKAGLCEHFMAACGIVNLNSIDVYLSQEEFPVFDGSAKEWVRLFNEAGLTDKPQKKEFYTVKEPLYYLNGKTCLVILPDKDLNLLYAVSYAHKDLKNRWVSFDKNNIDEIIEARTFGFLKDLNKYQRLGFARGAAINNTVGLTETGYTVELRSDMEPIKHKILDLFGDIFQTGISPLDLKCRILVKEAGHAVHIKVAGMLKNKLVKAK